MLTPPPSSAAQFDAFSPEQMLGFCAGVSVVFVGVYLLAPGGGEDTIEIGGGDDMSEAETTEVRGVRCLELLPISVSSLTANARARAHTHTHTHTHTRR